MPSDLAKKKAAKKKEAAKARQRTKKPDELNGESEQPETQRNGAESNGERRTDVWINITIVGLVDLNHHSWDTLHKFISSLTSVQK